MMRKTMAMALVAVFAVAPCFATSRLMQLQEDRYLVTHQKQSFFGGQGKALRMVYEKAGSLCVILGYSWFEIKDNQSKGRSFGSGAASTLDVKFYNEKPDDEIEVFECESLASEKQKQKMTLALERMEEEKEKG